MPGGMRMRRRSRAQLFPDAPWRKFSAAERRESGLLDADGRCFAVRHKKRAHAFRMRPLSFKSYLSSAEPEIYMRSVIQLDPESISKSAGQRFAVDAEQPKLVFTEGEAGGARFGIDRQVDRVVQRSLDDVRQGDAGRDS